MLRCTYGHDLSASRQFRKNVESIAKAMVTDQFSVIIGGLKGEIRAKRSASLEMK